MFYKFNHIVAALFFAALFAGCAGNKIADGNKNIKLNAENVSEGVSLAFEYIPAETNRVFIHFMEKSEAEEKRPIPVFTDIRGTNLDQLKQTGEIVCPFLKKGHTYIISVYLEETAEHEPVNWINTEIKAGGGTHLTNDVKLKLNDTQTGVTLSAEPEFSNFVQYAANKYHYMLTLLVNKTDSVSYVQADKAGLSWQFLPQMIDDLKKDNINLSDNLPAFVTAYCNINYGDIVWMVGIANTDEFTVAFP